VPAFRAATAPGLSEQAERDLVEAGIRSAAMHIVDDTSGYGGREP